MRAYLVTMGIRTCCLLLAVLVTPYGWYTFVFAAGAAVLPYIAVVIANAAQSGRVTHAVAPERPALPAAPTARSPQTPRVLRVDEAPPTPPREDDAS